MRIPATITDRQERARWGVGVSASLLLHMALLGCTCVLCPCQHPTSTPQDIVMELAPLQSVSPCARACAEAAKAHQKQKMPLKKSEPNQERDLLAAAPRPKVEPATPIPRPKTVKPSHGPPRPEIRPHPDDAAVRQATPVRRQSFEPQHQPVSSHVTQATHPSEPKKPNVTPSPAIIAYVQPKPLPGASTGVAGERQPLKANSSGPAGNEESRTPAPSALATEAGRHSAAPAASPVATPVQSHTPERTRVASTEKITEERKPPSAASGETTSHQHSGAARWRGKLLGRLERFRRYPEAARKQHQEGVVRLRFAIDRQGRVLSARIESSSGVTILDDEALALVHRAEPLPAPPSDVAGERIELLVPVQFFLK